MTSIDEYLENVDEVIKSGPYFDDWDSLNKRKNSRMVFKR